MLVQIYGIAQEEVEKLVRQADQLSVEIDDGVNSSRTLVSLNGDRRPARTTTKVLPGGSEPTSVTRRLSSLPSINWWQYCAVVTTRQAAGDANRISSLRLFYRCADAEFWGWFLCVDVQETVKSGGDVFSGWSLKEVMPQARKSISVHALPCENPYVFPMHSDLRINIGTGGWFERARPARWLTEAIAQTVNSLDLTRQLGASCGGDSSLVSKIWDEVFPLTPMGGWIRRLERDTT